MNGAEDVPELSGADVRRVGDYVLNQLMQGSLLIESIKGIVKSSTKTIRDDLFKANQRLNEIDGRLNGIDGRLNGIDGRLGRLENDVAAIGAGMELLLKRSDQ